ncbi:MAG: tRNA lysidine(34) synthetase TilS, partial [Pseudomonadota bacterium]|nr:tRNA lysidine(34) synthetase TilS [Pseudomonadota bacterium]
QIPGEPGLLRPFLDEPREIIRHYAEESSLKWVHDESNDNIGFDRNYLRHKVLPVIGSRFSAYRETFSRASRHLSESRVLLEDLAKIDAQEAIVDGQLDLAVLALMRRARQKNLLRYFLNLHSFGAPSAANLDDMLDQLLNARSDSQVLIQLSVGQIRCHKGFAHVIRDTVKPAGWEILWSGEPELVLHPIDSLLVVKKTIGLGVSRKKLLSGVVQIRSRHGGERLQPDCRRPHRTLKNLLQEAAMPSWERSLLPLIYCDDILVMVPGIGINCDFQAKPEEEGIVFEIVRKNTV